jgi:uncharacterized protein (DUF697 family)
MTHDDNPDIYERGQLQEIRAWKDRAPSIVGQAVGYVFKPLGWVIGKVVPPTAIEGTLRGADWAARQTLSEHRVLREAGVHSFDDLKRLELEALDALARSFHRWAVGYAVVEGGAAGAVGLPGIAIDIPAFVALALRTVRGIGACYGYVSDLATEREFVLGILSAAGANSMAEKTSALLFLRQLQVTLLQKTFKAMGVKAAEQVMGREAAIIAIRNLARQLGVNLTKRKMLQAIPAVGGIIGAAVNGTFIDDIAWAARRTYQERWLTDRGYEFG